MNPQEMSWKARINRYAKEHGIAPQVVLQNIMFERFLRRLSRSDYKNHFVLKGGVLVAAIVGLDYRSTMDIDTTLQHYPLSEETLSRAINEITGIDENALEIRMCQPLIIMIRHNRHLQWPTIALRCRFADVSDIGLIRLR